MDPIVVWTVGAAARISNQVRNRYRILAMCNLRALGVQFVAESVCMELPYRV